MRIFNTLSRKIENFVPIRENEVSIYTCGPTVYNFTHIGNFRPPLVIDLLSRWLKYRGNKVHLVMNITDVDDKIILNSMKQGKNIKEYTEFYKKIYFEGLKILNIQPAEFYPAATDHIPEMIELIKNLLDKGYAYETGDGIYFKISAFENYGALANLEHDSLKAGAGGRQSNDEYTKENISDFALWKKWDSSDGEVKWEAPFGAGRPGWHIECSAMSMKYLGKTLDIHSGAVDLIFPHHTNEIAQSEAATGKKFVNYWIHNEFLIINGEKMSKSKGNYFTLQDLLDKGFSPRSLRYALLTTHYRKILNFTFDLVKQADSSLKRMDEFVFSLKNIKNEGVKDGFVSGKFVELKKKFEASMDEDLNISEAMAAIFDIINLYYENSGKFTVQNAAEIIEFLNDADLILGFVLEKKADDISEEEKSLIDERARAKSDRNYKKADEIRAMLLSRGIEIRDTKDGVVWKRV